MSNISNSISDITIKRVPSWNRMSGMLAEWNNFVRHGSPITIRRAFEIAGNCLAVSNAKRSGYPMPKDWAKCHPSLPHQMLGWYEKITSDRLLTRYENPPAVWIELPKVK